MLKNYLITAFRNLKKFKVYSFINIAGLSISFSVVILLSLFLQNEISVDKFNKNYNRIYRISKGNIPAKVAETVKSNIPEIKKITRLDIISGRSITVKRNNVLFNLENVIYAEPDFFDIFSFKSLKGNLKTALNTPMSAVISKDLAYKIFGKENPVGKTFLMENKFEVTVNAVLDDIPQSSSIRFSCAISLESLKLERGENQDPFDWTQWNYLTYVLLPDRPDNSALIERIKNVLKTNIPEKHKEMNIDVIPFSQIYYNQDVFGQDHGSREKNATMILIAFLILFIALINFINLSTTRASLRLKEIGVRKTVGASRFFLISQFLSESVIFTVISLVLGVFLSSLFLPSFNEIINLKLVLFPEPVMPRILIYLISAILVGILSGIYPAFYLTKFKPDIILRGNIYAANKGLLRRILIIFQFSISIILIVATLVIYRQMDFMKNKSLGFTKDNIIYLVLNKDIRNRKEIFRSKIEEIPEVKGFAYNFDVPGKMYMKWGQDINYMGKEQRVWFTASLSSGEYMRFMNMKIVKGRGFFENDTNDYGSVIINEAFAKTFGIKDYSKLSFSGEEKVVGVVKNFNYESLHSEVQPLVMLNAPVYNCGLLKMRTSNYKDMKSVITKLSGIWKEISPDFPFEYNFLDESLANQYKAEERFEKTFIGFSLLAVLITCMGLFGLTSFTTEQKTKEIGIRKILGASVNNITLMLSKQFILLVFLANIIAVPVAFYFMNKWLQDFAYRIEINWWIFALAGGITLLIALITVSFQAVKAATANPVESLRYE